MIATDAQLTELLPQIEFTDRIAIDTEADSLHCYREKLCLIQISVPGGDFVVDPLAKVDLAPLCGILARKELILQGSDYDLRLLRRGLNFAAGKIFDTVIAARLLGIREFSLAALVKKYFGIELTKGSQKANWAKRPLSARMIEYAVNDTKYLLPLAEKLENELRECGRLEWFQQSCLRAIDQAAVDRERDVDSAWRLSGAGTLPPRTGAVLRELWRWRDQEAEAVDRPAFHILQNHELLRAAEGFAAGKIPDYHHFSARRRSGFREAAEKALQLPDEELPVMRRRSGVRPSAETVRKIDKFRAQRDKAALKLELEPAFVASRTTLEAVAADEKRANTILAPWQRELLGIEDHSANIS